jgi:Protein of unknown function (DUF4238)
VGAQRGVRKIVNQKKRHHFIAQTYLRGFCNQDGKLCVYSKDNPAQPWWAAPESIGFEKYYYSQPMPDGGQDNNRLEDFFSTIEADWPSLASKIERRERHEGGLAQLLQFVLMHRVRVPTARDAVEKMLAESVRMTSRHLYERGKLPPLPPELTFEYLDQHTVISIDPHKSIHAMADLAKGVARIFQWVGFEILENKTDESFITSDNPVIYFDPTVPARAIQPYNINRDRLDIEFMFPITPRFMLWGHSVLKPRSIRHTTHYRDVSDRKFIRRANVLTARFANRMLFSNESRHQQLVRKYAGTSPVVSIAHMTRGRGRAIFAQHVFGKREPKPKWTKRAQGA